MFLLMGKNILATDMLLKWESYNSIIKNTEGGVVIRE